VQSLTEYDFKSISGIKKIGEMLIGILIFERDIGKRSIKT
jgi:hypothetical protein